MSGARAKPYARRSVCVCAVRAVEVPVLVCLRSRDCGRRALRLVRPALKFVMQNDGDFVDVLLLYDWCHSEANCYTLGNESKTSVFLPLA